MDAYAPLLKEDPNILAPDIDLTKNIATNEIVKEKGRCEKCGKDLKFPYFLFVGIEKDGVEKVVFVIRIEGKDFNIENQYQWIFSDQNLINSKIRICVACYEEYKGRLDVGDTPYTVCIRLVYFAVEEYQRRHTPISFVKSDYERYRISARPKHDALGWFRDYLWWLGR
jgi:hypothetical protein